MNPLESQLAYPFGDTLPEPGRTIEVAPGMHWLRMPLPFALDHVNLWLLRDRLDDHDGVGPRDGWTIVDCGIDNATTRELWDQVFATTLDGLPVLRVVVTHMHPDHIGCAHWLTERWSTPERDCRLWISATDHGVARIASRADHADAGLLSAGFAASHGIVDPALLDGLGRRGTYYVAMVPQVPGRFRRLIDGDLLAIGAAGWRCHVGHGHAPEHMALHAADANVLIAGDMVLPRISTNIGVGEAEPEGDPLRRFLDSIGRLSLLPADTLVLPSHGRPFRGLRTRVDQLRQHHADRLAEVMTACAETPQTAAGLLPLLFRRTLDLHQTTFALAEAIAHLNLLWLDGRLVRRRGDDGVYRFERPAD